MPCVVIIMKKILLALNSLTLGELLQEYLCGTFDVVVCMDADETVELLGKYRPDVLVLDLMLGGMDSISILQAARDTGCCSKAVAVTGYIGTYTAAMLEELNVCHLARSTCNAAQFAGRIADIALWDPEDRSLLQKIRNIFVALGFKMNTESYRILECATALYYQDPTQPLTAQLYPKVAELCGGTATQVEKAIRTAVESAAKNGNGFMWQLYFETGKGGKVLKPTNGQFLARMAMCLTENEEKGELRKKII